MRAACALAPMVMLGGCVSRPPVAAPLAGPDLVAVARVVERAANQIRPCYRSPKLNHAARQIVTVLHVRYAENGMLATMPEVVSQSGLRDENRFFAGQMARAAMDAVIRCVPLKLPAEFHLRGWDEFDLTFSPKGLA